MSISLMSWVFSNPRSTPAQQLVLLALADNANDQGECWPGIDLLARKCCLSRQGVFDKIEELEKQGVLVVVRESGKVNRYRLPVNSVDGSTLLTGQPSVRVPVNPVDPHPSTQLTPPVNSVDPNHQEPSPEPSERTVPVPSAAVPCHSQPGLEALVQEAEFAGIGPGRAVLTREINGALRSGVTPADLQAGFVKHPGRPIWEIVQAIRPPLPRAGAKSDLDEVAEWARKAKATREAKEASCGPRTNDLGKKVVGVQPSSDRSNLGRLRANQSGL